jgi:hypothetical protein
MKRVYGIRIIIFLAFWFLTLNQGVGQALMESQFYSRREGIPYAKPTKIEKGPKGLIWVATEGEGLFAWNGRKALDIPEIQGRFVTDFNFLSDTSLFIATDIGLFYHNLRSKTTTCLDSTIEFPFWIEIDKKSHVWIASLSQGLFSLDDQENKIEIPSKTINTFVLKNDSFCFASNEGYLIWKNKKWHSNAASSDPTELRFNLKKNGFTKVTNDQNPQLKKLYGLAIDIASNGNNEALLFKDSIILCNKTKAIVSYPLKTRNAKILFTLEAIWVAGENGLHFIPYKEENTDWLLSKNEEVNAIESFDKKIWMASNRALYSFHPQKKLEISLEEVGYVFDLHYHKKSQLIYLASESGLYSWSGAKLTKVELPGQDGFAFHIESSDDKIWVAGGDALYLLDGNLLSTYDIAGVRDMRITPWGLLFMSFSGELGVVRENREIQLFENPKENISWVGFVQAASGEWGVISIANKLQWLDVENQKWLENELILEQSSPLLALSQSDNGEVLFLYERYCIFTSWNNSDLKTSYSLAFGSDYISENPQDAQVLFTQEHLLMGSKNRFSQIRWKTRFQKEMPKPLFTEVRTALNTSQSINPLLSDKTAFFLPYHSSFVRIQFGLDPDKDLFKWAFEYELIDSKGNIVEGSGYEQAVFPTLAPEDYTFNLFTLDPRTRLRSNPTSLRFSILPPIWQKAWFIFLIASLFITISVFTIRARLAKIREEARIERELNKLEGMALRLQMNPHFIFNALDSISTFIFKNEPKQAVRYLSSFARLIRATLESAHENLIPLRTEVDILKSYLELERLRTEERMQFSIECDEELQESLMVPPLVIQPYIENAVKHGLKPIKGEGWVKVRFTEEEDCLLVEIEDNGIGRQAASEIAQKRMGFEKGKSMSMSITAQRLKLLKQALGKEVKVDITDKFSPDLKGLGTLVRVRLPKIEDNWED